MPEFPPWKRQMAVLTDAAQLRQSQLRRVVSELGARVSNTASSIPASAVELAERARTRGEQFPREIVDELSRRVNVLHLATKHDVELQSRLGRNRVSYVLNEFLEAQRDHEEALVESLRSELREELQSFAAAVDDNLFAIDEQPSPTTNGEIDLVGDESTNQRSVLETTDD
jgi:hypothetical protein